MCPWKAFGLKKMFGRAEGNCAGRVSIHQFGITKFTRLPLPSIYVSLHQATANYPQDAHPTRNPPRGRRRRKEVKAADACSCLLPVLEPIWAIGCNSYRSTLMYYQQALNYGCA